MTSGIASRHSPEELAALTKLLGNNAWRMTPVTFAAKLSQGRWKAWSYLQYIGLRIARAIKEGNKNIIISVPPRHGKSELISFWTPLWVLDQWPSKRILLTSYGADLSTLYGRRVRDFILADQDPQNTHPQLKCRLRPDALKVDNFVTTEEGMMYSVGLMGTITGRGADVIIVDDYLKNYKDAMSSTILDDIYNTFTTTIQTRREPGGTIIVLATRWTDDDLIGRLVKNSPEKWEYIEIPAIAMSHDPIGRDVGEALCPERYDLTALKGLRADLGTFWFDAIFQQRPHKTMKGLIEDSWFRIIPADKLPDMHKMKFVRYWDLASKQDSGDYTVGTLMGGLPGELDSYVIDVKRGQWTPKVVEDMVKECAEFDPEDTTIVIEQDPGSAGAALMDHYKRNVIPGYVFRTQIKTSKKAVHAQPFLAAAEAGNIFLKQADWNAEFIKEFKEFPGGDNDDQVDSGGGAYRHLRGRGRRGGATWGRSMDQEIGAGQNQESTDRQQEKKRRKVLSVSWGRN